MAPNGFFGVDAVDKANQDFLTQHRTRFVFTPFMEASCTQIPGGVVHSGQIYPIQAPERRCLKWVMGADEGRVVRLEGPGPGEEKNVAVYVDSPQPIVAWLVQVFGLEGMSEIQALDGMTAAQFESLRFNEMLFTIKNGEGEPQQCRTAAEYRTRMKEVIQATRDDSDPSRKRLNAIAKQVLAAVERCERECHAHMAKRHAEIKDIKSDAPKRYSIRDRRALEFAGIKPIEETMQEVVSNQTTAIAAIPELMKLIQEEKAESRRLQEAMQRQAAEQHSMFAGMVDALKTISNNQVVIGAAVGSQAPAQDQKNDPKLKKQS